MSLLRRIVESLPDFFERVPDQSIIVSPKQETTGEWLGDKLISGMRSTTWVAVHLPRGGEVQVRLDRTVLGDKWRALWLDPKTGAREVFDSGTAETLTARSPTGGSIDEDWILLVERDVIPGQ